MRPATRLKLYTQFIQLLFFHARRCIDHHVATGGVLGERDGIADAVQSREDGDKPVEAKGDSAVWRCSILESTHQETELFPRLLLGEAEHGEHLRLQLAVVNTDGAAPDFHAVDHQVVGVRTYGAGIGVK